MADDERRAEIEAEAAKALRERFGRLGILSRAVVYNHPSGEEIARVVLDVADRVRDARGDDEAALGSMWTIMQTQFERGRIPECHGPTRNDARKMLAGFRRVAARDARGDDEACDGSASCPATTHIEGCFAGPGWREIEAARSPRGEDRDA